MCNGTDKIATLNVLRNKWNCNTQYATEEMKLRHLSSRGRDKTATDSYDLTCKPLQFHFFRSMINVAVSFLPLHIECCTFISSVAHLMLQFHLFRSTLSVAILFVPLYNKRNRLNFSPSMSVKLFHLFPPYMYQSEKNLVIGSFGGAALSYFSIYIIHVCILLIIYSINSCQLNEWEIA